MKSLQLSTIILSSVKLTCAIEKEIIERTLLPAYNWTTQMKQPYQALIFSGDNQHSIFSKALLIEKGFHFKGNLRSLDDIRTWEHGDESWNAVQSAKKAVRLPTSKLLFKK